MTTGNAYVCAKKYYMPYTNHIAIILAFPQMGENIGAAARAMANFGLIDLRIIAPRDGWPNPKAVEMASGAFDHMPPPQVFETFEDAVKDINKLYATTARARDIVKPVFTPEAAINDGLGILAQGNTKIGFVFGPERTGLENAELSRCHAIINVPTAPAFSSLNLAQCVLLICHSISNATQDMADKSLPMGDSHPVTQEKMDEFLGRLEGALDQTSFFKSDAPKPSMVRNIRNIFMRGDLSDQEVRTLHGVLTALIKKKN